MSAEAFIDTVLKAVRLDDTPSLLERYFADDAPGGARFTGRWFERHAANTDPFRFEAGDLLAVEALSVQVPPEAAASLLLASGTVYDALLRQLPVGVPLWEVNPVVLDGPASELHAALDQLPGVGWVTAGKLMAAKRPGLIPILDEKVRTLATPPEGQFWASMRELLVAVTRREEIERHLAAAPGHVTLLRRIDVVLWMRATGRGKGIDG